MTTWKDRAVQYPDRFKFKDITTGNVVATYDVEPEPGNVTEDGTPVIAYNMNKIENNLKRIRWGGKPY